MTTVAEPTGSLSLALAHAVRLLETDPSLAAEQASEILKAAPGHPPTLRLLAAAHAASGDTDKAIEILLALVHAHPDAVLAQFDLAVALGRNGRTQEAIATLQQTLKVKPDLPQGWRVLADLLVSVGDAVGADTAYVQHVRHSRSDPQLLVIAKAVHENQLPDAESQLRRHLKRTPTDVVAIRMLAELAERLGRHEDAENLLERCLSLAPGFHAARQNYALILHRANK
ncbi:MAG: tetratricopeptide repeat protein, partial [Pseudomonadota bacterium]|nr:tetratricopeptide repeat protein [Pseudomonadota bacterium]